MMLFINRLPCIWGRVCLLNALQIEIISFMKAIGTSISSKSHRQFDLSHPNLGSDTVKHTCVIHWYILSRDNFDGLLRDHPAGKRANVVQFTACTARYLS
jgi:hypothetical protein